VGRVVYSMNVSLDGYIEDSAGSIEWTNPTDDVHRFFNEQTRDSAAFLFGRGLYDVMEDYWTTVDPGEEADVTAEFARVYVDTPRIVFSDSLDTVPDGVRLVRSADAVAEVKRLKDEVDGPLDLGGPALAASLVDLIDEFGVMAHPVILGGGKSFFPAGVSQFDLELLETRQFSGGVMFLRYARA
jgi:dihydrofolate reductase